MEWFSYFKEEAQRRGIAYRELEIGEAPGPIEAVIHDPSDPLDCDPEFVQEILIGPGHWQDISSELSFLRSWHRPHMTHAHHLVTYGLELKARQRSQIVKVEFAIGRTFAVLAGSPDYHTNSELDLIVKRGHTLATRQDSKRVIDQMLDTYQRLT